MALLSILVLMLLGVPVAFALAGGGLLYMLDKGIPLVAYPQRMFLGSDSFPLLALPFFILAGNLMNAGGITRRLVNLAQSMVGHITGGLAHVDIATNMLLAGMSGSAVADTAATGAILIPEMKQRGYSGEFAAAVTASAGTIGPIIPPSIPFVILGSIAGISVGRLFLGGVIPGILMGVYMMIVAYIIARQRSYPREAAFSLRRFLTALRESALALINPLIIVGGILTGYFTPTESGAIACLYALIVCKWVYRELQLSDVPELIQRSVKTSCSIMIIIAASALVGWVISREQIPQLIVRYTLDLSSDRFMILTLLIIVLLILGCFLEGTSIMILITPVLLPIMNRLGVDLTHFGVILVLCLMIGQNTPPVGVGMYVACAIGKVSMMGFFLEVWPFLLAVLALVFMIVFFPGLVLFVPNLLMGS
jgi:tripartite ATP-independent transporter DctM subunit